MTGQKKYCWWCPSEPLTQVWWSALGRIPIQEPWILLPAKYNLHILNCPSKMHPLLDLRRLVCHVSGTSCLSQMFRKRQQKLFSSLGEVEHKSKTICTLWKLFCDRRKEDYLQAPIQVGLDLLTELYEQGLFYSAINSARSALSTILLSSQCGTFGCHP